MTQARESRPSAANTETAKNKSDQDPTSLPDTTAILEALDRLTDALTNENAAFEEGFRLGYGDGYQIGHAHGERAADETWTWALGAIGVGRPEANPDRRAANRWRLLAGHGPAPQGGDQ